MPMNVNEWSKSFNWTTNYIASEYDYASDRTMVEKFQFENFRL